MASLVCLPLGVLLWGVVLPRDLLLGFFGFGFMISSMAFLVRSNDPTRLVLDSDAITLYHEKGEKTVLPLRAGSRIDLYDSTPIDSNETAHGFTIGSAGPFKGERLLLYGHSLRNEPVHLTQEAFLALREEMMARHAVVIRDGPVSKDSTSVMTSYRLR